MTLREEYKKKINELAPANFNKGQKKIAKDMLDRAEDHELDNWYRLIIQRVKKGFVFDDAPKPFQGLVSILLEDKNRRINVGDEVFDEENKLIIGENYDALKNLLLTHKGRIDVIYIDPPYNTEKAKEEGNELKSGDIIHTGKFIFGDKFTRTGWLNIMNERLLLAKQLLSSNGVIFISIDDTEQAYLKVLMDEIFGEENFVANFNWQSSFGGKNDTKLVPVNTEYILCYSFLETFNKIESFSDKKNKYKYKDSNFQKFGKYSLSPLCRSSLTWYENLDFLIYVERKNNQYIPNFKKTKKCIGIISAGSSRNSNKKNLELREKRWKEKTNKNDWRFYWSKETILQAFENGFIKILKKNDNFNIYQKIYEKAKFSGRQKKIIEENKNKYLLRNVISDPEITSKTGNEELHKIFNDYRFSYPKPTKLIKLFLEATTKSNSIILDFFAGSGTTGHAVMELNRNDDGDRKFILCTNSENGIANKITYERLHRVIKGETSEGKNDFDWLKNNKPYINEKLRVFNVESHKCSLNDDISNLESKAKEGLKMLNRNYSPSSEMNLLYDLNSLHPLEED